MTTTVIQTTKQELQEIIEAIIDQKLLGWFNHLEAKQEMLGMTETHPTEATRLKPLPILPGYVPQGWKEAIYYETE